MGKSHFVAYIDESGDEGWKFGEGSSEWLVLGAAVFWRESEPKEVQLVDEVRDLINARRGVHNAAKSASKPLHFRHLKHEQRKLLAGRIGSASLRTLVVAVHKPSLRQRDAFTQKQKLYFFATKILLERISRLVYERSRGACTTELCFENRSTLDYQGLRKYLQMLDENRNVFNFGGRPGVFSPDLLSTYQAAERKGLQIADAVASSYFFALEPDPYGHIEDGYVRLMAPRAYKKKGKALGAGVKIWPKEAEEKQKGGVLDF